MDAPSIFTMARELAWNVSSVNPMFTDANLLKYANLVRREIENSLITDVDEDFFYRKFKVDTVANQSEYNFQTSDWVQIGMKKILSCGIKYTPWDTYYKPIRPRNTISQDKYLDELKETQPTSDAFFTIKNSSIFLYPAPKEVVTDGLIVEAIITLPDLTITSTESDIFPHSELRDYHSVIAYGIVPYIHKMLKQNDDMQLSMAEYQRVLDKMIREVGDRWFSITEWELPSGREFK